MSALTNASATPRRFGRAAGAVRGPKVRRSTAERVAFPLFVSMLGVTAVVYLAGLIGLSLLLLS